MLLTVGSLDKKYNGVKMGPTLALSMGKFGCSKSVSQMGESIRVLMATRHSTTCSWFKVQINSPGDRLWKVIQHNVIYTYLEWLLITTVIINIIIIFGLHNRM